MEIRSPPSTAEMETIRQENTSLQKPSKHSMSEKFSKCQIPKLFYAMGNNSKSYQRTENIVNNGIIDEKNKVALESQLKSSNTQTVESRLDSVSRNLSFHDRLKNYQISLKSLPSQEVRMSACVSNSNITSRSERKCTLSQTSVSRAPIESSWIPQEEAYDLSNKQGEKKSPKSELEKGGDVSAEISSQSQRTVASISSRKSGGMKFKADYTVYSSSLIVKPSSSLWPNKNTPVRASVISTNVINGVIPSPIVASPSSKRSSPAAASSPPVLPGTLLSPLSIAIDDAFPGSPLSLKAASSDPGLLTTSRKRRIQHKRRKTTDAVTGSRSQQRKGRVISSGLSEQELDCKVADLVSIIKQKCKEKEKQCASPKGK